MITRLSDVDGGISAFSKLPLNNDVTKFFNEFGENLDEPIKFINRIDELPNGQKVFLKLENGSSSANKGVVEFFNSLDDDVVETGAIVFNKFDSPDEFIDAIGDVKRTYYEGTKQVKATGEIRDLARDVFQRSDIDWDMIVPGEDCTNLEWMLRRNAPIGIDGRPIELHHFTQEEPGTMIEMLSSVHQDYKQKLHGLIPDGQGSFRLDDILKNQYASFLTQYWKARAAEQIRAMGMTVEEYKELLP